MRDSNLTVHLLAFKTDSEIPDIAGTVHFCREQQNQERKITVKCLSQMRNNVAIVRFERAITATITGASTMLPMSILKLLSAHALQPLTKLLLLKHKLY